MGAVAPTFKIADMNFQCPIPRRMHIDRKLIIVSMSMFSGSVNSNMAIILCQLLFFNMDATLCVLLLHYLNTPARNKAILFLLIRWSKMKTQLVKGASRSQHTLYMLRRMYALFIA